MTTNQKPNIPTVFIIFGATGDLMSRKIVPSLFSLYKKNKLPKLLRIIGVARREFSDSEFKTRIKEILEKDGSRKIEDIEKFTNYFIYRQGRFQEKKDYDSLAHDLGRIDGEWRACSNKLFYLAVPPAYYKTIFEHLSSSGLTIPCSPEEGWTRVIVEKPFGKDLATAEELDMLLGKLFKEEQVYSVDHYLGKEILQNILAFRFSNNLLENIWNNKGIERIEVKILEKDGVGARGEFYDGIGALRDIGQNHILQMLALVTMENPGSFDPERVRENRFRVLDTLKKLSSKDLKKNTLRAQYIGYKNEPNVDKASSTETYFRIIGELEHPRWQGIPLILEGGKAMSESRKEVAVWFKHKTPCMCPPGKHLTNKIVFSLEPKEEISIRFWSKKPGHEMEFEDSVFEFKYNKRDENEEYAKDYEKLLLDVVEGNQLLFISTKEIEAMWRFIDPILKAWDKNDVPLLTYEKGDDMIRTAGLTEESLDKEKIKREVGIIGLGKMGSNLAQNLLDKSWTVYGYNRTHKVTEELEKSELNGVYSLEDFKNKLSNPRVIILMLPQGQPIDEVLFGKENAVIPDLIRDPETQTNNLDSRLRGNDNTRGLINILNKGDIIIDMGNSFYKDSIVRSKKLAVSNLKFVDVGISGGPKGARYGASLMIGGDRKTFEYLTPLFETISIQDGYEFFEGAGAGHFVKMVHNGIEYGMMQAIAEGFSILKQSKFRLNLKNVARIYNNGSVIESRLVGWLKDGLELYGEDLKDVAGTVKHTGEGEWTIKTAQELGLKTKVIEEALEFRKQSENNPSYTGKILSALRAQFGGHKA